MAVRPRDLYGAQIDTTDPAYPHGKAQNVAVAGDGSGTPLEKEWLNDLWGFLQALLYDGGVTPSGVADKVGASQYLTSIKNVIGARLTTFLAAANEWNGVNTFWEQIQARGEIEFSYDPTYQVPKLPRILLPLRSAQPGLFNSSMRFYAAGSRLYVHGDGAGNALSIRFPIRVPTGSRITEVRVGAKPNASDISITVQRYTPDKTATTVAVVDDLPLTAPATIAGGGPSAVATALLVANETVDNVTSEYWVNVSVGDDNGSTAEIYFVDVRTVISALAPY